MHEAFLSMGWSVEELDKDYGEDLFVRIFDEQKATPYSFFVQAKSIESLKKYSDKDGNVKYPVKLDHMRHWKDFWEPVFLMVWDKSSNIVYWDMIQQPAIPTDLTGKAGKFFIPRENVLNSEGLKRISFVTRRRHERFQNEQDGANLLIERLSEALDAEISYDAQAGILYVHPRGQRPHVTFFGRSAERVHTLSENYGLPTDLLLEKALVNMANVDAAMEEGSQLIVVDPHGGETVYRTREELDRAVKRMEELGG
ncbi:DUF4365 domain-containing protein [Streptomyces griseoaurantiacus]|uniref:DUF4365 domain-containing protein n=1 Tax=Streptomyces griseoaurantiacus TaxID=68213 RepID=UPI0036CD6323